MSAPEKDDGRHVHTEVAPEFHTRLRMICVMKNKSLKAFAREALEEKLEREERELQRKSVHRSNDL